MQDTETTEVGPVIQIIPLNKLTQWPGNVRTSGNDESLQELAASIQAHGLIQNLVAQKEKSKYVVWAGKRRLAALQLLVERKAIKPTFPVPCQIRPKDEDGIEIGLAENVCREPMHPADEFEAFRALFEKGNSIEDIAARFGVTPAVVTKRLALARVSPSLIAKYRAGDLTLAQLQAFTLVDDQERQEHVWETLPKWNRDAHNIRHALAGPKPVMASDKRVKFLGLAKYEYEGGLVSRDLFAGDDDDEDSGIYLLDEAKLDRLVSEKLTAQAEALKAEGWKWVEIRPNGTDYSELNKFHRVSAPVKPLPPELQKEQDDLEAERRRLEPEPEDIPYAEDGEDEDNEYYEEEEDDATSQAEVDPKIQARLEEIDDRLEQIAEQAENADYPPDVMAQGGAFVSLDYNGRLQITPGLLDKEAAKALDLEVAIGRGSKKKEEDTSPYSVALLQDLTTAKTAAMAVELAADPEAALRLMVYTLALGAFGHDIGFDYRETSCLQVSATWHSYSSLPDTSPAKQTLNEEHEKWKERFQAAGTIWNWCFHIADENNLMDSLAYFTARALDGIIQKFEGKDRAEVLDRLGNSMTVSKVSESGWLTGLISPVERMKSKNWLIERDKWFKPTAENYFGRVSKPMILDALKEMGSTVDVANHKKAELAAVAEAEAAKCNWIPEPLRIKKPAEKTEAAAE